MRGKNPVRSARAQLSISENTDRILEDVAKLGLLGKTKAEVAARIVTDWIWNNEDRLKRQGVELRSAATAALREKKRAK
jgi:hypothetical protein